MSVSRRQRRLRQRESEKHIKRLGDLLGEFYTFLEQENKPFDDEVREKFITLEKSWKRYCRANELTDEASSLFNREVSASWVRRYAKPKN